jgi:hypothetical protein
MNCQDVARLIDRGSFGAINATDRQGAEAHAQQCRRCALLWISHSRLAVSPVPAMPPELSRRCLALVTAARKVPVSRRAPRLSIVASGLVALAAAASMLGVGLSSKLAPNHDEALTTFIAPPASLMPVASGVPSSAAAQALPVATQAQVASNAQREIPLFPPQVAADQAFTVRVESGREKFMQLHPEVTRPLPEGTHYDASILFRADGKVLDHSLRTLAREEMHSLRIDPDWRLPNDGGELFSDYIPKGTRLADGRVLGADLSLRNLLVRDNYDPARSSLRVEEIVRAQHADLMLPTAGAGASHLTVLLSGAGAIQREVAGYMDGNAWREQEDWNAMKRAEVMARVLGVSKEEIGLMGSMPVFDDATKRGVLVDYAWKRQPGESAPQYRQGGWDRFEPQGVDIATALQVAERVMPDAFMGQEVERALGIPTILLSDKGEFIQTGRTRSSDPRSTFPGVPIATFRMLVLKNGKGATSAIYFMWRG